MCSQAANGPETGTLAEELFTDNEDLNNSSPTLGELKICSYRYSTEGEETVIREDTGEGRYGQLAKSSLQFTEVANQWQCEPIQPMTNSGSLTNYFPFLGLNFLFVS